MKISVLNSAHKISLLKLLPLAAVMLAACTTTPPSKFVASQPTPQWEVHQQAVQKITQYQARGSFAYLSSQKKVYARFFWQQYSPERYKLLLTNPLGSTELELNVAPGLIQVMDNKGQRYVSDNLDETLQNLTGMALPLESMRLWMLGLPSDSKKIQLNDQNLLQQTELENDGKLWSINYQGYNTQIAPALPNRLDLTQDDLRIKLKIDSWTLQ